MDSDTADQTTLVEAVCALTELNRKLGSSTGMRTNGNLIINSNDAWHGHFQQHYAQHKMHFGAKNFVVGTVNNNEMMNASVMLTHKLLQTANVFWYSLLQSPAQRVN
jgi:hypothetical protein